jgi:glutaredoxin
MKKMIVLVLLVAGGYFAYKNVSSTFLSGSGAFDEQGNPRVIVFTMDNCGAPCADVKDALTSRNIGFEEVNIMTDEGRKRIEAFGGRGVPFTVIGRRMITGSDISGIESVLAETWGGAVLTGAEQMVMQSHFDSEGNPRVVVYGASWCGQCKKLKAYLEGNSIPYLDIDVEKTPGARQDFDVLKGRGFPLIYVGYRSMSGFNEAALAKLIKEGLKKS